MVIDKCIKCKKYEMIGYPFCSQTGSIYCVDCHNKRNKLKRVFDAIFRRTIAFDI